MATPALQNSSANAIITLIAPPVLNTPIVLTAFGRQRMIEINAADNVMFEKTVDGQTINYVKPGSVTGSISIQATSSAMNAIKLMSDTMNTSYYVPQGTLSVTNPVGAWSNLFTNFTITTPFKGFSMTDHVEDYTFNFAAELPDANLLGQIINAGIGILNLAGSL